MLLVSVCVCLLKLLFCFSPTIFLRFCFIFHFTWYLAMRAHRRAYSLWCFGVFRKHVWEKEIVRYLKCLIVLCRITQGEKVDNFFLDRCPIPHILWQQPLFVQHTSLVDHIYIVKSGEKKTTTAIIQKTINWWTKSTAIIHVVKKQTTVFAIDRFETDLKLKIHSI